MFIILLLLLIKHWIADFVLQSDWQVSQKGVYGAWGGIIHSFIHGLLTAIIMSFVFSIIPVALIAGVLDSVIHYHIDYIKARFGEKDPNQQMFWTHLGLDQLCHYCFYLWLVWILFDVVSN